MVTQNNLHFFINISALFKQATKKHKTAIYLAFTNIGNFIRAFSKQLAIQTIIAIFSKKLYFASRFPSTSGDTCIGWQNIKWQ